MVKSVQAEESISAYFDGLLKDRIQAEVGLLIGKASVGSRDLALVVVPTPSQDGEQVLTISSGPATAVKPKKAGTAKAKTSEPAFNITVETECIAEHALQVSRMLPGGISVIGLYLFAPESGYNNCSNQLCKTLTTIAADMSKSSISSTVLEAAAAVTGTAAVTTGAGSPPAELLLLHVDSASRKFTVRTCQVSIPASVNFTVKPCELKFGSSLSSLVPLQCTHKFHLTAPTAAPAAAGEGTLTMQQLLQNAVAAESARVLSAVAAAAGQILTSSSQPIGDLLTSSSSSSDGSREAAVVDLYCLPTTAAALHSSSSSSATVNVSGNSWLQGTVEALAYVHKRDPVSKALLEIKNDVIASLAARLQLLADEALVAADDATADYTAAAAAAENGLPPAAAAAHPLLESTAAGQRVVINLARRVLLPWGDLNLQVCDYLSEGEGPQDAVERAQQLLQIKTLQPSSVVEVEQPGELKADVVAAAAAVVKNSGCSSSSSSRSVCSGPVLAAAAAGLVAAVSVGVAYMSLGQQ